MYTRYFLMMGAYNYNAPKCEDGPYLISCRPGIYLACLSSHGRWESCDCSVKCFWGIMWQCLMVRPVLQSCDVITTCVILYFRSSTKALVLQGLCSTSVSKFTGCCLEDRGFAPGKERIFLFSAMCRSAPGAHQNSYSDYWRHYPGRKC